MTSAKALPIVLTVLATFAAGSVGTAQDSVVPQPGARLRVTAPAVARKRLVGTLLEASEREIVLAVSPSDKTEKTAIPRESILRLERSVQPSRKVAGMWIGFGLSMAAMFGKVVHNGGCNDGCNMENVVEALAVAIPAAALGAIAAPGEVWADVPVQRPSGGATLSSHARLQIRLVPQAGRRTGLNVVASF